MAKTATKKTAAKRAKRTLPVAGKRPLAAKKSAGRHTSSRAAEAETAVDAQVLAHGLNGLLHTMHAVQQFEETLCSLMHALQRGRATGALMRDLREVLDQLPARDYLHEVDALRDAVAA